MASAEQQLNDLINSWGCEIRTVKHLPAFHDVSFEIIQRLDTMQYIKIAIERSWKDGVADRFTWSYIKEDALTIPSMETSPNPPNPIISNEIDSLKCEISELRKRVTLLVRRLKELEG